MLGIGKGRKSQNLSPVEIRDNQILELEGVYWTCRSKSIKKSLEQKKWRFLGVWGSLSAERVYNANTVFNKVLLENRGKRWFPHEPHVTCD